MYGTADGVVHLRRLADGGAVGGADVGTDSGRVRHAVDADPGENGASVSFADTSTETALGQLFVAHNDGGGIEIAHFDEADGSLVQQFAVPGTAGHDDRVVAAGVRRRATSSSSPAGELFKVPVADAQSADAAFGTPEQHRRRRREPAGEPDARLPRRDSARPPSMSPSDRRTAPPFRGLRPHRGRRGRPRARVRPARQPVHRRRRRARPRASRSSRRRDPRPRQPARGDAVHLRRRLAACSPSSRRAPATTRSPTSST